MKKKRTKEKSMRKISLAQFQKAVIERKELIMEYLLEHESFARVGLFSDDILNTLAISWLTASGLIEMFERRDSYGTRYEGIRVKHPLREKRMRVKSDFEIF